MTDQPPAHTIDALYAIGRNLVNFQRLEQILKGLALFAPICATPSRLQSEMEKRVARVDQLTLGGAVKKWIESEYHDPTNAKQRLQPDDQIMISFGFEVPTTSVSFDKLSGELKSLAQERNRLIHLELAQMNFGDEAECKALSIQLNAQNERIIRATKSLESILTQMRKFARLIASDQGLIQELVSPTFVEEDAE